MRMSTMWMRKDFGLRGLLCLFAVLLLLAGGAAAAEEAPAPAVAAEQAPAADGDVIFESLIQAGYRYADAEDNRAFLQPYDPLKSGPVVGFDLLYLKPSFGTASVAADFLGADDWTADIDYSRAAKLDFRVLTQKFTHAREHETLPPDYETIGLHGDVLGESHDADAGDEYSDTLYNTQATLKVRVPGYPAHFRASGRVFEHKGTQQMIYFFRSCSTELCHVNSRTRTLDEETREYNLGADAHAGPVDIVYNRTFLTFRDKADDPVDAIGNQIGGLKAGNYTHDVNPDLKSFKDSLKVNSNLANRMVFSLAYTRQEQENETSGITRGDQRAALDLTYTMTPALYLAARMDYEQERTLELSDAATATRAKNNASHVSRGTTHQHVMKPKYDRWGGDLRLRYSPQAGAFFILRVGHRVNERNAIIEKVGKTWDDDPQTSGTTEAALDGQWRFGKSVTLDGTLGQEWTDDPFYATDATSLTRFGLGATWTPTMAFSLRTSYVGYRGENDDAAALEKAYAGVTTVDESFSRQVSGNAVNVAAVYTPGPAFTLTAAYMFSDNGIVQDMRFGGPTAGKLSYVSEDTDWSGQTHIANLHAALKVTERLKLTGEGVWVSGRESYDPNFSADADLEELSTVDIAKLYAALGAEIGITKAVGLTLTGFWTAYDDKQDDGGDGHALGILAAIDVRL